MVASRVAVGRTAETELEIILLALTMMTITTFDKTVLGQPEIAMAAGKLKEGE